MFLPIVGMVVTISPSLSLYKIVVLPAASRPTVRQKKKQCELWTRLEPEKKEDGICCWRLELDRRQEVDEDEYHTKSWAVREWEKQPVSQDTVVEIWLLKSDPWMNYLEIYILKNIFAWTVHVPFITLYWKFYS